MHCIGMDVHSKSTMICVLGPDGKTVRELTIRGGLASVVTAVKALGAELGPVRICYEASTGCGWLQDRLRGRGRTVQVAHPGRVRMIFRAKRKNDRIDARKLAVLAYLDQVPLAHIPSAARRQWRSLIEFRRALVERRGAIKNSLRAILRGEGLSARRGLWTKAGLAWLEAQDIGPCRSVQRDLLLLELDQLRQRLRVAEKILLKLGRLEPWVGLLMTIPGVGIRTAEAVVAYVDDPRRFRRIKSVGCYFGLVPCEDTSLKRRLGHITKEGPPTVRKYLTEATWQAIRRDASVRAYYQRLCRQDPKRRKIALIATAHHLLRVMLSMMRTGECWRGSSAAA